MNAQQLEQRIREGIPITQHMDFRVLTLTDKHICVSGGGEQNVNVHGTAFAGSLYAICTLAVWGLVNSRLPENAALVMAEGNIHYHKPVIGEIVSHCSISEAAMDMFLQTLHSEGRARLLARSNVPDDNGFAAEFSATVYARIHKNR